MDWRVAMVLGAYEGEPFSVEAQKFLKRHFANLDVELRGVHQFIRHPPLGASAIGPAQAAGNVLAVA